MKEIEYKIVEGEGIFNGSLYVFEKLSSTNEWARENIDLLKHGDIIWTKNQIAGIGRMSRRWITFEERCLTFSVLIKTFERLELNHLMVQVAAMSVRECLDDFGINGELKWPNDVLINGKKIAGILGSVDLNKRKIVLGIGINVNMDKEHLMKLNIDRPATSMQVESGRTFNIEDLLKRMIKILEKDIKNLTYMDGSDIFREWSNHDYLKGAVIQIDTAIEKVKGRYKGIDDHGRLYMVDEKNRERIFWSGDVDKVRNGS